MKKFWNRFPGKTEDFLRARERYCVAACFRYLNMTPNDRFWYADESDDSGFRGLIVYARRCLFPVFLADGKQAQTFPGGAFSLPGRLRQLLTKDGLHAVQGLRDDLEFLLPFLECQGFSASEIVDYDLMQLDLSRRDNVPAPKRPREITIRPPVPEDLDALFPLQSGYEHEEVIPRGGVFNPAACRNTLRSLIAGGRILVAETGGRIAGKINVNAESFTRLQIGGVYVDPAFRGRGIAKAMTAEFVHRMMPLGKGFTLFVKTGNPAARAVYDRTGFTRLAAYRIAYFLPDSVHSGSR
jgi:ribosomal protein S18 acetylase RimI-like enzyme